MAKIWTLPFRGLEELAFKPVPEGWVYRVPNPFLFAPARYCLLNAQQKAEVAAWHRKVQSYMFFAIIIPVMVGLTLWQPVFERHALIGLVVAMAIGGVIGLALNAYLAHKVKPLVAGLPATARKITPRDALKTQISTYSRARIITLGSISLVLCAGSAMRGLSPAGWDFISLLGVLAFGGMAIYWLAMLVAKARQAA